MPSPILARADALMQRRVSSQTPGHDTAEDFPILTDAFDEEENIPILLQVESAPEAAPADTAGEASNAAGLLTADLAADLARALEVRLQAALPGLIEQAIADVMNHRPPEPETGSTETTQ